MVGAINSASISIHLNLIDFIRKMMAGEGRRRRSLALPDSTTSSWNPASKSSRLGLSQKCRVRTAHHRTMIEADAEARLAKVFIIYG